MEAFCRRVPGAPDGQRARWGLWNPHALGDTPCQGAPERRLPAGRATVGGLVVLKRQVEEAELPAVRLRPNHECIPWVENDMFPLIAVRRRPQKPGPRI